MQQAAMHASSTATGAADWFRNSLSWKILKPPCMLSSVFINVVLVKQLVPASVGTPEADLSG